MPTTTNNGWPTPADTDLVKNGADAIRDLGNAIDTTLGVYVASSPGLTKINTTSMSAVASQSINSVFSSTYTNYKIIIPATAAGENLNFRMRVSGADETGSIYSYSNAFITSDSGTQAADRAELGSLITFGEFGNGFVSLEISNPFAAQYTSMNWVNTIGRTGGSGRNRTKQGTAIVGNTTSYTGFSIYVSTGSITGSVTTYGYNV